jgi:predicted nucleic acid-binding protein
VTVVLDAGALVAAERWDRDVVGIIERERRAGRMPVTHGGVVGQVWRGAGPRQAVLARLLAGVDVVPLDEDLGRRAGVLLARSGARDVIDAAVVLLAAADLDEILTSDPRDIAALATAAGTHADVIAV